MLALGPELPISTPDGVVVVVAACRPCEQTPSAWCHSGCSGYLGSTGGIKWTPALSLPSTVPARSSRGRSFTPCLLLLPPPPSPAQLRRHQSWHDRYRLVHHTCHNCHTCHGFLFIMKPSQYRQTGNYLLGKIWFSLIITDPAETPLKPGHIILHDRYYHISSTSS